MDRKKQIRRLPDSELDLMLAVWNAGEAGVTAPELMGALERPLTASALHSYLKRLEEKGFLACIKEGKTNCYTPLISKEDYQARESRTVLERLYDNSLKHFTAALYDGGGLSPNELQELRDYLDELSGQ